MTGVRAWTVRVSVLAAGLALAGSWSAGALGHSQRSSIFCPQQSHPKAAASRAAGTAKTLVPPGSREAVLCRYRFAKRKGIRTVTDARTLKKLTREYDALKPPPTGNQARKCPNDDGTTVLAGFSYQNGFQTWVTLQVTGCQLVSGEHITRWARPPPGPRLTRQLLRETGCPRNGGGQACFTFR